MLKGDGSLARVARFFYLACILGFIFATIGLGQQFKVKILQPQPETELNKGETLTIEVTLSPSLPKRVFMTAVFQVNKEVIDRVPLYDDGDPEHFDQTANDGIFANGYTPRRTGRLTMRVRAYWDNNEVWSEPITIIVRELTPTPTQPTAPVTPPIQQPKPTRPLGFALTILGFLFSVGSIFALRRTIQPQGGLGVELRFVGKREALLVGPKGTGDIIVPNERFSDLKLARLKWEGLSGLLVQGLQARAWVEETKRERLREGINHIKVSQTIQGAPVSGEVIVNVSRFVDENRIAIGSAVLGIVLVLLGITLMAI